jgi:8-oxo-dGTP pyrophosphatase MutT (NUDIX family)
MSNVKQRIAAKAIIKNSEGQVLVLRQSFEKAVDGAGLYHPPGGIVEPGEILRETLKREVKEETN